MELSLDISGLSTVRAVDGMRQPFVRSFGRGWVARRLAQVAWPAFRAALLHGSGIAVAGSYAQVAAEECNSRTMLVARWTNTRIHRMVQHAVQNAANAA